MHIDDEDDLSVGEIARACGVSADTVRHYERKGVLPAATRRPNGYRSYPRMAVARVQMVRRAVALGFGLDELARIFRQRASGKPPCREVHAMAARKLGELDARIADLCALRDSLAATIRQWDARLAGTPEAEPALLLETLS